MLGPCCTFAIRLCRSKVSLICHQTGCDPSSAIRMSIFIFLDYCRSYQYQHVTIKSISLSLYTNMDPMETDPTEMDSGKTNSVETDSAEIDSSETDSSDMDSTQLITSETGPDLQNLGQRIREDDLRSCTSNCMRERY